jgi:hypothetical protein
MGKGQSPLNNPKVIHWITGAIASDSLKDTASRIPICPGTHVTIQVSDQGEPGAGGAINTANSTGMACDEKGCFVGPPLSPDGLQKTERYISRSQDGSDTDRMTLILAK